MHKASLTATARKFAKDLLHLQSAKNNLFFLTVVASVYEK